MIPILLSVLVQVDGEWWNRDWACRRPLEIRNNLEGTLPAGHPVGVELNPDFLGLHDRARPDLSDLVVVHSGRRVPSARMPGRNPGSFVVWFPTAAPLAEGKKDTGYAFYYGNPDAPAPAADGMTDFGVYETFDHAGTPPAFLEAKPPLTMSIEDGRLLIRDGAPARPGAAPARVSLRVPQPGAGFALSMEIFMGNPGSGMAVAVEVDLAMPGSEDPGIVPRVRELIGNLGNPDWERREKATRELIRIGLPASMEIEKAAASGDAEIRWRAQHCLRMIRENSPPPLIQAGIRTGDPEARPVALTFAIGKIRGKRRHQPEGPVRMKIDLQRDQDGDVTLLWNGSRVQTGHLPGRVRGISLTFAHAGGAPPPAFRVDNLLLRRCVDEESRPTYVLDPEERRP